MSLPTTLTTAINRLAKIWGGGETSDDNILAAINRLGTIWEGNALIVDTSAFLTVPVADEKYTPLNFTSEEPHRTVIEQVQVNADVAGANAASVATIASNLSNNTYNFATDPHSHDDRYYTETEIDDKLSGVAVDGHDHDERYYTESEVDGLLAGKSDTHPHPYLTITDADTRFAAKADTPHTHDDRYYTETEVNNLLAGKSNTNHTHNYLTQATADSLYAPIGGGSTISYGLVRDEKPQGTSGGTFTAGAWRTRTLNTIVHGSEFLSLSNNRLTVEAGDYIVRIICPAYYVGRNQSRLRSTDNRVIIYGSSSYAYGDVAGASLIVDRVVFDTAKELVLEHRSNVSKTNNGFGVSAGYTKEIYTIFELWRLS